MRTERESYSEPAINQDANTAEGLEYCGGRKRCLQGGNPGFDRVASLSKGNLDRPQNSSRDSVKRILADLKPGAAWFFRDDVDQGCSIVFDMNDAPQSPAVAEPWFIAFNAQASLRPIMNPDCPRPAHPIGEVAKQHGKKN